MKPEYMAPEVGSLAHYGVKGMKWGKRRTNPDGSDAPGVFRNRNAPDASGITRKQARAETRAINRQTSRNLEDFNDLPGQKRDQAIRTAREGRKMAERKYEDVVREVKGKKGEVGRNATKIALAKARAERYESITKSETLTQGEATVKALMDVLDSVMAPVGPRPTR